MFLNLLKNDYWVMGLAIVLVLIVALLWHIDHGRFYNPFI
ncbi:Putative uncharacterized protein [Lactobacillus acidophilus DSM 20079 = JCM 1132 = NBRC 13951 = CIP 76.13]|nr:Putative uncharacterized protein [Lactobacillus acidophilus DSM 20079 = JCM 1132 = NBRC 13951 = CIP 76.13]